MYGPPSPALSDSAHALTRAAHTPPARPVAKDESIKQLKVTLEWRAKTRPWEPCPLCVGDGMSHNVRLVGYDAAGTAVIFTAFGQAHDRKDKEMAMKHFTSPG